MGHFIAIFIILFSGAVFNSVALASWEIFEGGKSYHSQSLKVKYALNEDKMTSSVIYKKNIAMDDKHRYLVLPVFFGSIEKVKIGRRILHPIAFDQVGISNIFRKNIYYLPKNVKNSSISIYTKGIPIISGFRGDDVEFKNDIQKSLLRNYYSNDIHAAFLIIVFISILGLFVFQSFTSDIQPISQLFLLSNAAIVPYLLLGTGFWPYVSSDLVLPFVLSISGQLLSLSCFAAIGYWFSYKKIDQKNVLLAIAAATALISFTLYFGIQFYLNICSVTFLALSIFAVRLMLITKLEHKQMLFFIIPGMCFFITNIISDITISDVYLLGYGVVLYSASIIYTVFLELRNKINVNNKLLEFLKRTIPETILKMVVSYINQGFSINDIRNRIQGDGTIVTVFLDLIGYSNSYKNYPKHKVKKAKETVFEFYANIFRRYHLDLFKPMGDRLHFSTDIGLVGSEKLSDLALDAIIESLTSYDQLADKLYSLKLPVFGIKISAVIGPTYYHFDGYDKSFHFDTEGDYVNDCARLETHMDEEFYNRFGRNVALISKGLLFNAQDTDRYAAVFLPEIYSFRDKHGNLHECYVSKKDLSDENTVDDIRTMLYGDDLIMTSLPSSSQNSEVTEDEDALVDEVEALLRGEEMPVETMDALTKDENEAERRSTYRIEEKAG